MKRRAPAASRNREAIWEVLRDELPRAGLVFEIASGSGEHVVDYAARRPDLTWQPSDRDDAAVASIQAWVDDARTADSALRLRDPLRFDVETDAWPQGVTAVICINMVHISPWPATQALLAKAAADSGFEGPLFLYGPYRQRGVATAPSNEAFDDTLKARNPAWGLRFVEDVVAEAARSGLMLTRLVEMPANNLSLVFRPS